jgi:hypothetical protein
MAQLVRTYYDEIHLMHITKLCFFIIKIIKKYAKRNYSK